MALRLGSESWPRMRDRVTRLGEEYFNKIWDLIDRRLHELESVNASWTDAVNELNAHGLARLEQVLGPSFARLSNIAELGFLIAHSVTTETLVEGEISTFVVPEGDERDLFHPSAFVTITKPGSDTDFAIGKVLSYVREVGSLDVEIMQIVGDPGPHDDWEIIAGTGVTLYVREKLTEAQAAKTAAEAAQAAAEQARDDTEAAAILIAGGPVSTVNGQGGTVVLGAADVGAPTIAELGTEIATREAADEALQDAIEDIDTRVDALESATPPAASTTAAGLIEIATDTEASAGASATLGLVTTHRFTKVTEATTSGSITLDGRTVWVLVELWGAGGGGGSGRKGSTTSNRFGGHGGNGGERLRRWYKKSDLPAGAIPYAIGAAGVGGAPQTVTDTSGNAGTAGGSTTFGTAGAFGTASGGAAGQGGPGSSTSGTAVNTALIYPDSAPGQGGSGISSAGNNGRNGGSGGGAGGNVTAGANVSQAGSAGGREGGASVSGDGPAGGSAGTNNGTNGTTAGDGGGGGGSNGSGTGGNGGAGHLGGGGGGGGGGTDPGNSGAGANGGAGFARFTEFG